MQFICALQRRRFRVVFSCGCDCLNANNKICIANRIFRLFLDTYINFNVRSHHLCNSKANIFGAISQITDFTRNYYSTFRENKIETIE